MSIYTRLDAHRSMLFDEQRNRAYFRALEQAVRHDSTVLDLGAGLGMHGLMAARLGAAHVYLVDPSPVIYHVERLARANGVENRIEAIRGKIEDLELPRPVDIIVSVFAGNFLLDEDLLPSLFFARDRFLSPDGVLIPDRARMMAGLVSAEAFHAKHVARWSEPTLGLDFSAMRSFAANGIVFCKADQVGGTLLSDPARLTEIDLATACRAQCQAAISIPVRTSGTCHGLLGWFDMRLGDAWVSTGPGSEPMHWSAAFLPIDPPLDLQAGQSVDFELDRPEFGEWTWTVTHGDTRQRHSTFKSNLADIDFLKRQSPGHTPGLGKKGELALYVLSGMSAGRTVGEIASGARERFPRLAERDRQIDRQVRSLAAQWGLDED